MIVGDDAVHGEEAYALFFEGQRSHYQDDFGRSPMSHDAHSGILGSGHHGMSGAPIIGKSPHVGNGNKSSDEENGTSKEDEKRD